MKTTVLSTGVRVLVCLLGVLCALYGTFALIQCFVPTFGTDGEQSALTPTETACHAVVALVYSAVFFVPPRLLAPPFAYWLVLVLRVAAFGLLLFLVSGVQWSRATSSAALLLVFFVAVLLFASVASSLWELRHVRTSIHGA